MKRVDSTAELSGLVPSYPKPQPGWLPWHIARFCFHPRFVDPKKNFASQVQSLVQTLSSHRAAFRFDVSTPEICVVSHGQATLIVNC